jgi:arylsulfatase B
MRNFILSLFLFVTVQAYSQRNVILLIADDIGTDYFSFYEGHQDTVIVPNIKWLLDRGVQFNQATSNPVCSATRAGILSGRYSFRTGVGYVVGGQGGSGTFGMSEPTLPAFLKIFDSNIGTANIGKWHLHGANPTSNLNKPNLLGYDHFEGPFIGGLNSYYDWWKVTNGSEDSVHNYATTENIDNALSWINTQGSNQFFTWIAFNAPHSPYHLPPMDLHSYDTLNGNVPHVMAYPKAYFKASMEALDTEIGRLIDSLSTLNLLDSTDFIFIGDNGNAPKTVQIEAGNKSKGTVYEYGVHVPFIISGPSVVNPGRKSNTLVNTQDIFATVQELMGNLNWESNMPINMVTDSKSLLPIILDLSDSIRAWSFTEVFKNDTDSLDGKAMRNYRFKLIRFDYGHEEFYDLLMDTLEEHNLLDSTLNEIEIDNYLYLCNEMNILLDTVLFCQSLLEVTKYEGHNDHPALYPNPFQSKLMWSQGELPKYTRLLDCFGREVYAGQEIDKQDFTHLKDGVYFIEIEEDLKRVQKLIHQ